jgi:DNA-binding NtrC family response regulator
MRAKILIVDDDPDILLGLENRVTWMGHEPLTADNGKDGLRLIQQEEPDLVLLDIQLPVFSGMDVLKQVHQMTERERARNEEPGLYFGPTDPPIIVLTAFGTIEKAVEAMKLGAVDFVTKPFTGDHLTVVINKALDGLALRRQVQLLKQEVKEQYGAIVGTNERLIAQLKLAKQAASSNVTVLVLGETGTGKEVVARAIHEWSPRRDHPFVAVNCAAIPKELLENELFGHEKGAFTGAVKREPGKIEIAEGGTVFLDEIGDMSMSMQSHLLRVLQDQTFYRVGGTHPVRTNVRFLAATNRDLKEAIRQGSFREDLYYRLEVISITLPPLRDRMNDLEALAAHFLGRASGRLGVHKQVSLSAAALRLLSEYQWPGNIRELENVLTRAYILATGDTIEPEHLHLAGAIAEPARQGRGPVLKSRHYHENMETFSCWLLEEALKRNDWNQTRAAEELGLQRTYFTKLLRQKQIRGRPPKHQSSEPNEDHPDEE